MKETAELAQSSIGRLTKDVQELGDRMSKTWVTKVTLLSSMAKLLMYLALKTL